VSPSRDVSIGLDLPTPQAVNGLAESFSSPEGLRAFNGETGA
jgi:hypothetical protein